MTYRLSRKPWQARLANRLRADVPLAFLDCGAITLAYLVPFVIRYEGRVPEQAWVAFWPFLLVALPCYLLLNFLSGLYGQVWRYASVQEARKILFANAMAGMLLFGWAARLESRPPISVVIFGALLTLGGSGVLRFQSRLFALHRQDVVGPRRARVLVVGAGGAGASIVRSILADPSCGLYPVAFVDDDPRKRGRSISETRVVGTIDDLASVLPKMRIEKILVALPEASAELYHRIASESERHEIPVLALPRLDELVGGQLSVRDIRDLGIEDLIGRQLVETDLTDVAALLLGRRVLVTGAGGSIGAEIVRQISSFGHGGLFVLDNDETHLHDLALDVAEDANVVLLLADIRDSREIARIFDLYRPEVVFHAAAHKHVPMLEIHPQEAVKTNIVGTMNVAEAALHAGVERFILISTDKAIQPVSIMGITKLLSERVIRSLDGRGCRFTSVRFGNVVGSRGSVVPTFMRQIAHGGPVTVTDPEMTRYFMSISEAVQLVLQAAALARGGEVFTLDPGAPINILTLARRLIRLAGRVPDRDVPIVITGVRPGERLTENLMSRVEHSEPTQHPQIVRSSPQPQGNARLRADIQQLMGLVEDTDTTGVRDLLQEIADRELTPTEAVGVDLVGVD